MLVSLVCMLVPAAVARADFTWSGAGPLPGNWSVGSNWSGTAPTNGTDAGMLTFPSLPSCASDACYQSNNDLNDLSVDSLTIDDNDSYMLTGDPLTVGEGGITAQSYATGSAGQGEIDVPLTLGAAQTWTFNGIESLPEGLVVGQTVAGTGADLDVNFDEPAFLQFNADAEVGQLTATGTGVIELYDGSSLNGTDENPLTLSGGTDLSIPSPGSSTGPITSSAQITVGRGNAPDGTLAVQGPLTLTSGTLNSFIDQDGTVPSADFSQLTATGAVSLGGSLDLAAGNDSAGKCGLAPGDTATLIATTGTLSGTFSNAADGSLVQMDDLCNASSPGAPAAAPEAQINYTLNAVTATIVTPTSTSLAASSSAAATNQPVTLTAIVSPTADVAAPAGAQGTVEFENNGSAITNCGPRPVSISGNGFVATCTTTFGPGQESLTASYSGGADYLESASSSSDPTQLMVAQGATSTALGVSNPRPLAGSPVTLTAAVMPANAGAIAPTGTVEFVEDGTPIADCANQQLTPSSTATCTTSLAAGTHSITAAYGGDQNFLGSTSAFQLVAASAPQTLTPPPPEPSAATDPATAITKTSAILHGVANTAGAAVSWQFELGRGAAYSKGTAVQTLGSGRGSLPVSATIKGLAAGTRYRFVLVVMQASPATTADGGPLAFTTKPNGALLMPAGTLKVSGRSVHVPEQCTSANSCTGRFSITVGGKSCVAASYRVKAHRRATVAGALASSCLKRLRAAPDHRLSASFTTAPRTGQLPLRKTVALARG